MNGKPKVSSGDGEGSGSELASDAVKYELAFVCQARNVRIMLGARGLRWTGAAQDDVGLSGRNAEGPRFSFASYIKQFQN